MQGMRVLLDEIALEVPNATLSGAMEAVRDAAGARGRIVIEVLCDGRPADEGMLAGTASEGVTFDEVRCRSADPLDLVCSTLDDGCGELDRLVEAQRATREKLWIGQTHEALNDLRGILDTWRLVRETFGKCVQALGVPISGVPAVRGRRASEVVAALGADLESLKREIGAQRFVELADLVGTDLCARASEWRDMMAGLSMAAHRGRGGARSPGTDPAGGRGSP